MTAVIDLADVSCGYDEPVLEHVDLRIERGESVALLGRSGSGKSTLLATMLGLVPPLAGTVRLFGEPLATLSTRDRRSVFARIGVAFQQDGLFSSLSLADNVALPLRELTTLPEVVIAELVRMKLALVELGGLDHHKPAELSGGQRKRAALARASILDPELLACDEPTAGLDPVVARGIDETLQHYRSLLGSTVVVVTHELATIRTIATRIVMLADGRVHASGTFDELAHSADRAVHELFHTTRAA